MTKKHNIEIEQGSTFTYTIDLLNADGTEFDATGWTSSGTLRKHYAANAYHSFTTSLSNGSITFSMTPAVTANIKFGLYVYDVRVRATDNTVHRVVSGMATVSPQVDKT